MLPQSKNSSSTLATPTLGFVAVLVFLLSTLALPFVLLYGLLKPRWREGIDERLGGGVWRSSEMAEIDLLIHAASVGEVKGVEPLLNEIQSEYPSLKIGISTTSLTGRAVARELLGENRAALLPLDHPWIVGPALARISPRVVLITETELWPSLLLAIKRLEIPVSLINARISDYSFPNYARFRKLLAPLLRIFRLVATQTEIDAQRFGDLGVPEDKLFVFGSTKYDREVVSMSEAERQAFAAELGIDLELPCFVAGSVRPGEDGAVIRAYQAAREQVSSLQLVITPRHPERFEDCAELLKKMKLKFHRRSSGLAAQPSAVVLLDTLGELQKVYALATFSYVGATLVDIGGHNPLEPAACGAPVLMGPYVSTVRDAVAALQAASAVRIVETSEELAGAVVWYCQNPEECKAAGARAKEVWRSNLGASKRTLDSLRPMLTQERPTYRQASNQVSNSK